jgi:hypothetical protein
LESTSAGTRNGGGRGGSGACFVVLGGQFDPVVCAAVAVGIDNPKIPCVCGMQQVSSLAGWVTMSVHAIPHRLTG